MLCGGRTNARGEFAHLVVSLAPERVDIGMFAGGGDRGIGRAAEIDRDARLLDAADSGRGIVEAIVGAGVRNGTMLGPDALQDVHILAGARVAFILVQPVAVAMLVDIVATTDHMNGGASGGDLVERDELAGRDGGGDEAWTMRHKEADAVGVRGGLAATKKPSGASE